MEKIKFDSCYNIQNIFYDTFFTNINPIIKRTCSFPVTNSINDNIFIELSSRTTHSVWMLFFQLYSGKNIVPRSISAIIEKEVEMVMDLYETQ